MTVTRGTTNRNDRGSAESRRRRKVWLLVEFGDGDTAPCSFCGTPVTFETITVDRFPVPGCEGGRYVKGNIRPACGPCNYGDGARLGASRRRPVELWRYAIPVTFRRPV